MIQVGLNLKEHLFEVWINRGYILFSYIRHNKSNCKKAKCKKINLKDYKV